MHLQLHMHMLTQSSLWTAYPIVFALTEGANKVSVDAEIIAYGVLDV
jgi:bacteriorhodopsin